MIYWVLLNFIGFHCVLIWVFISEDVTQFYWLLLDCTWFHLLDLKRIVFNKFGGVLLDFLCYFEFYRILPGFTGFND